MKNLVAVPLLIFLLFHAFDPFIVSAQPTDELTEPDNTYLKYDKDRKFNEHPSRQNSSGDSIFTVLGRWAWGYCLAVDTKDNYAFIGNGATFQTLDITNPASPTIVGEYIVTNRINDIVIRGSLAYVAMAEGLVIMDISDPTDPQQLGELFLSGIPQQLVVEGSIAYVLSWGTGLMHVVDVSNPSQPIRRSAFISGEFNYCIAVRSGYVYLGIPNVPAGILRIVNATRPDSLSYRDTSLAFISRTATTADTLLLIGATQVVGVSRVLKVFSVANPAYPRLLGEVVIPGRSSNTGGICVVGTKAYLAALDTGVVEVDIANPAQPQIQRVFNRKPLFAAAGVTSVSGIGLAPLGDWMLVPYYTGLLTVNKAQQDSLSEISFFPTGGVASDIAFRNNIAFIACSYAGLWLVDLSNPFLPRALSNIQNGGPVMSVVVSDSLTFVVNTPGSQNDTTRGLWTIDATNILQPRFLSHYVGISSSFPSFTAANPAALMEKIIVAGRRNGFLNDSTLEVVDASNPGDLRRLSVVKGSYSPVSIAVKDSILYVSTSDSGLLIIDSHVPSLPVRVARLFSYSGGITVHDTVLVVMSDSLYTLSIRNPAFPIRLGSSDPSITNAISFKMAVERQYLYLAERNVLTYDISDPMNPTELDVLQALGQVTGVAAFNDRVFVVDAYLGLWVFHNDLITDIPELQSDNTPNQPKLYQNFPNPFNPSTSISFYLPRGEHIQLELYNLLGQKLRTLLDGDMREGFHSLLLDASTLPSGVYYYRLVSSVGFITRKMALIK